MAETCKITHFIFSTHVLVYQKGNGGTLEVHNKQHLPTTVLVQRHQKIFEAAGAKGKKGEKRRGRRGEIPECAERIQAFLLSLLG